MAHDHPFFLVHYRRLTLHPSPGVVLVEEIGRAGQGTPHSADGKAWPPVFEGKATK
jgi:hypothetical protein